jgi:hypothetical protein
MIHIELITPASEGIYKKWGNLQMKFMICLLLCAKGAPMELGAWFEHTSLNPLLFQGCCNPGMLPYKQTTPF